MWYRYFIIIPMMFLFSCEKEPIETKKTKNKNFYVDFLFEADGVKVYRFRDGTRYHYFTSRGETISTQQTSYFNVKTTSSYFYDEHINGED